MDPVISKFFIELMKSKNYRNFKVEEKQKHPLFGCKRPYFAVNTASSMIMHDVCG